MDENRSKAGGGDVEVNRAAKIRELLGNIKDMDSPSPRRKRTNVDRLSATSTKEKTYKAYIGWKHKKAKQTSFKAVRSPNGGGVRCLEFLTAEPMTVEDFISKGKEMFFPNGVNTLSSLNSVDVALGNYAGATITCFRDVKNNQCSFQDYLHSHGLFSSRTSLYLLTTERINTEAVKGGCAENAEKETMVLTTDTNLEVKYMISKTSIISNNESRLTCFSLEDCKDSSFTEESRTDGFNPLLNGYTVVGISKDQKEYLDYDFAEDGRIFFKFPQSTTTNNIILHVPDVLNGFEVNGKDFLVGVISSLHGCDINYIWMKDGIEICKNRDLPILVVKESGRYSVAIQIQGMIFNYSNTVDVDLPQLNNSDGEFRQNSEFGEECELLEPPIKKICQNSVQKINKEDIIFNAHNIGKGSLEQYIKCSGWVL